VTETLDFSTLPDVASLHPELAPDELWFASHMYARERAYEAVFGISEPDGQILSPGDPSLAINWPGGGVFQYPPERGRSGWHYVTHGLAQPDSPEDAAATGADPEGGSGCGIELVISTPAQCHWAPHVLLNLVKYMLFQKGARLILPGDRVPCNGPIVLGSDTQIRNVIAVVSPEYPSQFRLPAGLCQLVHLVGVTDRETAVAKAWGTGRGGTYILAEVLRTAGIGCVTNPERSCLASAPEFQAMWLSAKAKLESEWAATDARRDGGA
jgi:hypothetical protein